VKAALVVLAAIYARLGGDPTVMHAARENLLLPVEFVHVASGTVVELDGAEHFTSFRLQTLDLYPADAAIGFDLAAYRDHCRSLAAATDLIGRGLAARGFGFGFGGGDGDGAAAYERECARLRALLTRRR
jgi:hypothetical protein